MTKKSPKRKRKKSSKTTTIDKKFLAKSFIALSLIAIICTIFAYIFLKQNENLEKNRTIDDKPTLKEQKKYTNEEVMQEVLSNLSSQQKKEELIENLKKLDEKEEYEKSLKQDISSDVIKKVEEIKKDEKKEEKQQEAKEQTYEIKDEIIESPKTKKPEKKDLITSKDKYKHDFNKKPKLAIVIDDVVTKSQKDKILDIGYPVTMAFLPPTPEHKDSAKIATNLPFYIVHLPLQASKAFKSVEINTLNITDSYEKIESRIKQIREWYPNAKYTNNHTGSVFTENFEAMDKLFKALKKYNFIFVDSKTSPNSVAKELSVKYKVPYIVRDTFLDNNKDYKYIQNQLKDAIRVAKKEGFAVAIGHPYDVTIKVLKESKHLLNEVEPIFLNKLPYL